MFGWLKSLLGIGEKAMEKIFPDRAASREAQSRINEAEVAGAPASRLRLWRSFLGWALSVAFIWEVIARPVIVTYWPEVPLPDSVLKEVSSLLLGMLGLGF
ncbi:3TM-type holin [uncultured Desulfovibrio sp.]|uniref:3TM-type holin n=1 Tax=uncultured Desulfovibrio sp. TaxID=167968 RepID=UPI002804F0E5|nr:hypothetical protein [uncultured Desulfovibrio sp.]